jgi:hypothetical protein
MTMITNSSSVPGAHLRKGEAAIWGLPDIQGIFHRRIGSQGDPFLKPVQEDTCNQSAFFRHHGLPLHNAGQGNPLVQRQGSGGIL